VVYKCRTKCFVVGVTCGGLGHRPQRYDSAQDAAQTLGLRKTKRASHHGPTLPDTCLCVLGCRPVNGRWTRPLRVPCH